MASVPSLGSDSLAQPQFPTPSPFSYSAASTRWSSRPSIHNFTLSLRFLAFLFSFTSALSLAVSSPKRNGKSTSGFTYYPELMYSFVVSTVAFTYTAVQLFKGVFDMAYRGIFISEKISEYISFFLDLVLSYLLVSSSSASVPAIQRIEATAFFWKAAIISVSLSFAAFLVIVICTLLSGYKLCKRIIW